MADAVAKTSTPDPSAGNPIDVTTVTTGAGSVDRQRVSIADAAATNNAGVTAAGALKVDGSGVTQPVSGNVGITGTPTVDVGNFPASQAVTFAAGAAIELLDSAGTNKASISAAGAVKVDGSAVTQPISGSVSVTGTATVAGTVTANQGTAAAVAGSWPTEITDGTHGPAAVKAASTAALATDPSLVVALSPNSPLPAGSAALGSVSVSNFPATQPVSIAATVSENIASVSAVAVATAAAGVQLVGIEGRAGTSLETTAGVLDHNVKNVGNAAVSTAASGVQKVGIVGSAGGVVDAAGQNAVSPANEVLVGAQFNTTPTGITSGNMSPLQCDTNGNLLVRQALTRTTIAITLDTTSVSTTEVLQTVTIAKGVGVATTTGTSYTVTTGKTLRIQAVHVSADASTTTTAFTGTTVRLVATSAAIATTSPRFIDMHLPAEGGGTLVSGAGVVSDLSFPDGLEIPATDLIAISAIATGSTAVAVSVTLVGFEY